MGKSQNSKGKWEPQIEQALAQGNQGLVQRCAAQLMKKIERVANGANDVDATPADTEIASE